MNLYSIVSKKDKELLSQYLKNNDINETNEQGRSGLDSAVSNDFPEGVFYLLDTGIDTTIRNKNGDTALHIAVKLGMKEAVEAILKKDLSALNIRDADGNNVLWTALFKGRSNPEIYFPIADILLKAGVDHRNKNNSGKDVSYILQIATDSIKERILDLNSHYNFLDQ